MGVFMKWLPSAVCTPPPIQFSHVADMHGKIDAWSFPRFMNYLGVQPYSELFLAKYASIQFY